MGAVAITKVVIIDNDKFWLKEIAILCRSIGLVSFPELSTQDYETFGKLKAGIVRSFKLLIDEEKRLAARSEVANLLKDLSLDGGQSRTAFVIDCELTENCKETYANVNGLNFYKQFTPGQPAVFIYEPSLHHDSLDNFKRVKELCKENRQCRLLHKYDVDFVKKLTQELETFKNHQSVLS